MFTSNHDFTETDVDAWWIAYDAICLVDAEINASNRLLASRPQKDTSPPFDIQRVSGASSPILTSENIRPYGWTPCSAQLHVGNVQRLIDSLGGHNLYGETDHLGIALRELIQNARDAVAARQALGLDDYCGKISVKLERRPSGATYLVVQDDGVGMSERVLRDTLPALGKVCPLRPSPPATSQLESLGVESLTRSQSRIDAGSTKDR